MADPALRREKRRNSRSCGRIVTVPVGAGPSSPGRKRFRAAASNRAQRPAKTCNPVFLPGQLFRF